MRKPVVAVLFVASALAFTHFAIAQEEVVYEAGPEITLPRVVREVKPQYTQEALQARVAGDVYLKVVVRRDGKPSDIEVTESLHPDLDKAAVAALGQWEFTPGTRKGEAVPVRVAIVMTFTLK